MSLCCLHCDEIMPRERFKTQKFTLPNLTFEYRRPTNLVPRLFTYARRCGKDPGWNWSREPPDFGGKSNWRLFATKGGVVEGRMRFSCLRITTFVK